MINSDDVTKENIKEHNPNWPQIPDNPYRIIIRSGKTNSLFNLINYQQDATKIYLYAKDDMDDIYENIEEYNRNKICKILIVFDDMIADMHSNKKLNAMVTELSEAKN